MAKTRLFWLGWMLCALMIGCQNSQEENPITPATSVEVLSEGPFTIEISNLHASYCTARITPLDTRYGTWFSLATEEVLTQFGSLDDLDTTVAAYIRAAVENSGGVAVEEQLYYGAFEREVIGLLPETRVVAFACHVDERGELFSRVQAIRFATPRVQPSSNQLSISISDLQATSATVHIQTTNQDHYTWLELPSFVYADKSLEEIEAMLLTTAYRDFLGISPKSGDLTYTFPGGSLEPDTEYMVIAFGYDSDITTPMVTRTFRTRSVSDPSQATFTITTSNLTSRGVDVTVTPSDHNVAWLAILADEAMLSPFEGTVGERAHALIDAFIEEMISAGEFSDRKGILSEAHYGEEKGSYALTPGQMHYLCVVGVDALGNLAEQVTVQEVLAPSEEISSASVSVTLGDYYACDALARLNPALYGDYLDTNWAFLQVNFTLNEAAELAVYTLLDEYNYEDVSESEVTKMLLNESYIGTLTNVADGAAELKIEFGLKHRLYMIALGADNRVGDLVVYEIDALDPAQAAPAEEYRPIEE